MPKRAIFPLLVSTLRVTSDVSRREWRKAVAVSVVVAILVLQNLLQAGQPVRIQWP